MLELPRLVFHAPQLAEAPRGEGERVLVIPGFLTNDLSTVVLRRYLAWLGYRVSGWGMGVNHGKVRPLTRSLVALAEGMALQNQRRLLLVGWSLGGFLAREVARERPDLVAGVITLGSPVEGGPKFTRAAGMYERRGDDLDKIAEEIAAREVDTPLRTPVAAIFSRRDRVVAWQACIDRSNPNCEHLEVGATHVGLGMSGEVLRLVAERLDRFRKGDMSVTMP